MPLYIAELRLSVEDARVTIGSLSNCWKAVSRRTLKAAAEYDVVSAEEQPNFFN